MPHKPTQPTQSTVRCKCAVVKLSFLKSLGRMDPHYILANTSDIDRSISTRRQAIKSMKSTLKSLNKQRQALNRTYRRNVSSGNIKPIL